jgi:5-methyltetrahydrofolate--homocysteine methyltransferase
MGATIEALKVAGLRDKVKVMVGGAPVTEEFARSIGADAFAPDASSATRVARQLVA